MEPFALASLFFVALTYGATACMLSCVPLLSPILLANSARRRENLRLLLPITAGRITGYTLLSLLAFAGSSLVQTYLNDTILTGYLLGTLTLFLALRQYRAVRNAHACTGPTRIKTDGILALFATGVILSMSLCAPVTTMLSLSAAAPSLIWALAYGIIFGLGATLLWFLFFSVILTAVFKESLIHLNRYRRAIELASPAFLALIGIAIFNGWLRL